MTKQKLGNHNRIHEPDKTTTRQGQSKHAIEANETKGKNKFAREKDETKKYHDDKTETKSNAVWLRV